MTLKTKHPIYPVLQNMKERCRNHNLSSYKDYGGRGIRVCERWLGANGFANFLADMGDRPLGHTIERRDNDGPYSPDNCYWATRKEQQKNRRITIRLEIAGVHHLLSDLSEKSGLKPDTIKARHAKGLTYEQIIDPTPTWDTAGLALGGKANGERQKAKTHCPQGHEYTPDNLTADALKKGWRRCKACHMARQAIRNKAISEAKKLLP